MLSWLDSHSPSGSQGVTGALPLPGTLSLPIGSLAKLSLERISESNIQFSRFIISFCLYICFWEKRERVVRLKTFFWLLVGGEEREKEEGKSEVVSSWGGWSCSPQLWLLLTYNIYTISYRHDQVFFNFLAFDFVSCWVLLGLLLTMVRTRGVILPIIMDFEGMSATSSWIRNNKKNIFVSVFN